MPVEDLTTRQVAQFREAFNLFDRDGDGVISSLELGVAMRVCGATPTEFQLKEWAAEASHEDQITVDEFLTMMAKQYLEGSRPTDESLREAFLVFAGADSQFEMASAELKAILMDYGEKMTEEEVDEAFKEAGIGRDSQIDFNAFIRTILKA